MGNRFGATRDGAGVQLELPRALRPSAVRLDAAAAREPTHPLYFHRHEAQTLLGDPATLAGVLARFVCERMGRGEACAP